MCNLDGNHPLINCLSSLLLNDDHNWRFEVKHKVYKPILPFCVCLLFGARLETGLLFSGGGGGWGVIVQNLTILGNLDIIVPV